MKDKYLELLAYKYKNQQAVISEIMNLSTILTLPKGTEFFFSDLHGEYKSFIHLLKSASGVIKNKIDLLYQDELDEESRQKLAHLIYYPQRHLQQLDLSKQEMNEWYEETIYRLITVAKFCSTKYTRSKVNKKLPQEYAYVITEMLNCHNDNYIQEYYHDIIQMIISIENAEDFIDKLCLFIRKICIDHIHIIGDIFDRGPRPDFIIDELMRYQDIDIEWGNHDISWMGAACGNQALIANVIRIALSYNNLDVLEDGYGMNLRVLSEFAKEVYADDPCLHFQPHILDQNKYDPIQKELVAKMHKAITIIQLKLEGQLIERHPEYHMNQRNWLKQIHYETNTVTYLGKKYDLNDSFFPTINKDSPLELSLQEQQLMTSLVASFKHSQKLHSHIQFLYQNGSMYKIMNDNIMYHGCIPMNEDGSFQEFIVNKNKFSGKALLDEFHKIVNDAYFMHRQDDIDMMWYLWCGASSPLFGKDKLCVFEKYFIDDVSLCAEKFNPYYLWIEKEETCQKIFQEFQLSSHAHIINGHVPVKLKDGESPVRANGRLYMIDGGISKAYQPKTGIAGYTLIYDSQHLSLAKHQPYNVLAKQGLFCLTPEVDIIETSKRIKNRDCDIGKMIQSQIDDLHILLQKYRQGYIKEQS